MLSKSSLSNIPFTVWTLASEMYPTNLYYLPRPEIQELNKELARYWRDLSGFGEEQMRTFEEAGYYSVLARPGLRVLTWNTNYG